MIDDRRKESRGGSDRRVSPRKRVLKRAIITTAESTCTIGCCVSNLSETGAKLAIERGAIVPSNFVLEIELDGLKAPCTVVWREGCEIGVAFDARPAQKAPLRRQKLLPVVPPSKAEAPKSLRKQKVASR